MTGVNYVSNILFRLTTASLAKYELDASRSYSASDAVVRLITIEKVEPATKQEAALFKLPAGCIQLLG